MNLRKKGFQLPDKICFEEETLTDTYGKLIAEPLERGFGTTIGNSLRRILLSSIEGAAVTAIKIEGALHEFTHIRGVKEDITDIILNIKKLRFKMFTDGTKVATIKVIGPADVKGADIQVDSGVEVLTTDLSVVTVEKDATFEAEMYIKKGKGYVPADVNKQQDLPVGMIAVDSIFSPIKKVSFHIERARVGMATDYDRLVMEIWTDGSITPKRAVSQAASILIDFADLFIFEEAEEGEREEGMMVRSAAGMNPSAINENLLKSVDELELSVRAFNCLKSANIKTIAELVQKTEQEMLRTKNFGRKSLNEIKEILHSMGLYLGMKIDPELIKQQ